MFSRKHNARVAQIIKSKHLIEMTPEEVDAHRKNAWATIRQKMVERGYPEAKDWSDEELLALLRKVADRKGPGAAGGSNNQGGF